MMFPLLVIFSMIYFIVLAIATGIMCLDIRDGYLKNRKRIRFDSFFPAYPIAKWLRSEV